MVRVGTKRNLIKRNKLMCVKLILWYTKLALGRAVVVFGAPFATGGRLQDDAHQAWEVWLRRFIQEGWNGWPEFRSAIVHQIGGGRSAVEPDRCAKSMRAGRYRDRQRTPAECIRSLGCEDRHQLPRHVDLPEWVSGDPGSSSSSGGSVTTLRQYAGTAAWSGTTPLGVDRRGVRNGHLGRGWRNGGRNGC